LTSEEAVTLVGQISGLTRAGLTLPGGFRAMAEELGDGSLPAMLRDLALRVEQGEPLATALEAQGKRLPDHLRGLIEAGVETDRLADVLSHYVNHSRWARQLRRRLQSSMIYPAILLGAFITLLSFLLIAIVPKFQRIFIDFRLDVPRVTSMLFRVSDWAVHHGFVTVLTSSAVVALLWVLGSRWLRAAQRRRLLYKIPIFGPLSRDGAFAEFARLLSLLLDREIPLPVALRLAAGGIRDADVAEVAHAMATEIESGLSLADSRTRRERVPVFLAQSLHEDGTESLADSLRTAAELLQNQASIQTEFVIQATPPVTMILIVVTLGFVVFSLLLPLINLIDHLAS
jgi:type II secretory pathway component PulF